MVFPDFQRKSASIYSSSYKKFLSEIAKLLTREGENCQKSYVSLI